MRKLVIIRKKDPVGAYTQMKVYTPDLENRDLDIFGTPCRKLGEVPNGETLEADIPDTLTRIYTLSSEMTLDLSCVLCELPAGEEDITLHVYCIKNEAGAYEFRVPDEDVQKTPAMAENELARTQNVKKAASALIKKKNRVGNIVAGVLIALFAAWVVISSLPKDKDFSLAGMTITLSDDFYVYEREEDWYLNLGTKDVFLEICRYSADDLLYFGAYEISLETFVDVIKDEAISDPAVYDIHDPVYTGDTALIEYKYHYTEDGYDEKSYCFVYLLKSGDEYWLFAFSCDISDAESCRKNAAKWFGSVKFET